MRYRLAACVFILFIGCLSAPYQEFSIYYFYHPACPNCIAVAPYIDYLEKQYKVEINRYDVSDPETSAMAERYSIAAVPTLLIITGDGVARFVGRIEVTRAEYLVASLSNMPPPERPFNVSYELDPMQCLQCHQPTEEQRKLIPPEVLERLNTTLPPPSTYSCSYCCHKQ